jgi:hypothetical protein
MPALFRRRSGAMGRTGQFAEAGADGTAEHQALLFRVEVGGVHEHVCDSFLLQMRASGAHFRVGGRDRPAGVHRDRLSEVPAVKEQVPASGRGAA